MRDGLVYEQKDEETFWVRFRIRDPTIAQEDVGGVAEGDVEIQLIFSPTTESSEQGAGGAPWRLYDTILLHGPSTSRPFNEWSSTPAEARNRFVSTMSRPSGQNENELQTSRTAYKDEESEDTGMGGADDFWGGYSDDEKEADKKSKRGLVTESPSKPNPNTAKPLTHPVGHAAFHAQPQFQTSNPKAPFGRSPAQSPMVSRFVTPDDHYWAAYSGVEDGLRASNPPSPGRNTKASVPVPVPGDYWGTGGETPVSWSPPIQQDQPLPRDPEEEEAPAPPAPASAVQLTQSNKDSRDLHIGVNTPNPESQAGKRNWTARQLALEATLKGLKELYVSQRQAGQSTMVDKEFEDVLKSFL